MTRTKKSATGFEQDVIEIYDHVKKCEKEMKCDEIAEMLKKALIENGLIECDHTFDESGTCTQCKKTLPMCPVCKKRKYLFSDYNMCHDCWGDLVSGYPVVDG